MPAQLTLADVQQVIAQAATRASQVSSNSVIAVSDREGYVLGVWRSFVLAVLFTGDATTLKPRTRDAIGSL